MDQLLFEQNPNPMLIYDLDTLKILKINTSFSENYGYSCEEIKQHSLTIMDIRPDEDGAQLLESLDELNKTGISKTDTKRHQSKSGDIFYVNVTSQPLEYKNRKARLVVCHDVTDRIEAEKKSTEAFQELRHHIKNSPLASVKWDHDFRIVEWSEQAEKISGYAEEEILGKTLFTLNFFEQAEIDHINKKIQDLVHGEYDRNQFETSIRHKNGKQIYIKIHSSARRDAKGELQSVLTMVEDITEQKKSKIKYQRLFENANDSILILKNGQFVDCNKRAEELYKASRQDIIGKDPIYFSPGKQPDGSCSEAEADKRIEKALEEGSHLFEWQHQNTEGDLIDVEVSLNTIRFPDGEYLQAIVRDVTDKKRTQAELRKNEELFRNLFLKSPAALVMVDHKDCVQVVNESFEQMFEYTNNEIKGEDIDDLIVPPGEPNLTPTMKDKSYIKEDFQIEGLRLTKSGTAKHVIIAGMPVYVDGKAVAGFGMYIDITDRKKSERELRKSLHEKQVLLEEVHHRVKNNLAVVSGLLQMQTMHVDDKRLTRYIQNSQLRIQSMATVHEMLYQSSTLSEIKFRAYVERLVTIISDVLEPDVKNISVEMDVDDLVLNVNQAIPCALIISELITNAYEYAFKEREKGELQITITERGNVIRVAVQDNGVGLPDNFEELRVRSLGMSLIENLCRQLNTNIEIESDKDGSCFRFVFELDNKPGSSSLNRPYSA